MVVSAERGHSQEDGVTVHRLLFRTTVSPPLANYRRVLGFVSVAHIVLPCTSALQLVHTTTLYSHASCLPLRSYVPSNSAVRPQG